MKATRRAGRAALAICATLTCAVLFAGCSESTATKQVLSENEATEALNKLLIRVQWSEDTVARAKSVDLSAIANLAATLPPISEYPIRVQGKKGPGHAEICASSEKSGKGTDGWMNEVAKRFNTSATVTSMGAQAQVSIRKVASGTCHEYIASGQYVPQGFSPSNVLWVQMVQARGTTMDAVAERLVGNTAGVVMKEAIAEKIRETRQSLGITDVIEAVAAGEIAMGYTNPFASSTGLNFLATTLMTYAGGDESKMLDPAVVSAFESFQGGVPFVALTTMQMRDAVGAKGSEGALDAFVMERQTFDKEDALRSGWEFIAFGVRHDNPLYAVGSASENEKETLNLFAKFALSTKYQDLATEYGFNTDDAYAGAFEAPNGATLRSAQKLWKEKKDSGKPIVAVFAVDVSGSMAGEPLAQVRMALTEGAEFISPNTAIGLVAFSGGASVRLPVKKFNLQHKARFLAAIDELEEGGGTALYDAVAVSMRLLREARVGDYAQARPRLIVLSDGETRSGHGLKDIAKIVTALKIPVYTIAYGNRADTKELQALSGLAEAAALKANERRVTHIISSLLNAQL